MLQENISRVCHLTTGHVPFDDRIFHRECKTLANSGYNVTLVAQNTKNEIVDGVSIIALPKQRNRIHRILKIGPKAFWLSIKQKADIYHFHDPELIHIGLLLKLLTGKPVIYDCHEYYSESILSREGNPKMLRLLYSLLFKLYEKITYPFFDYVFGVIDGQNNDFPRVNFLALHNYPLKCYFDKISRFEKEFDLIYAGTISEERGLFMMLDLVKKLKEYDNLKNIKLALLGDMPNNNLRQKFENFVENNYMQGNVLYFGHKSHEEVINHLRKAKIGLRLAMKTKQYDNKPQIATKIFEYMAVRIPTISTDFTHTMEFMGDVPYIFYVPENDGEYCAQRVKFLLENDKLREEIGERAYHDFIMKYTWEVECKKLLRAYDEMLNRARHEDLQGKVKNA